MRNSGYGAAGWPGLNRKGVNMRRIGWIAAALGSAALVSAVAVQGVAAASPSHPSDHGNNGNDGATVLRFHTMAPVTGPYVGAANPVRGIAGGGLPWMINSGRGSLDQRGRLEVRVRGLVLANNSAVPAALRGTNPVPAFDAVVSCQSIAADGSATVSNVATATVPASPTGNAEIRATVKLPQPCIAPVIFVGPPGAWFAATGS
jgi:hypothetical protein